MISLTEDPCTDSDWLCTEVLKATDNEWLAAASNWLIAKPVAILGLVLVGVVARYLIHKLVDQVARRAEQGMIPEQLVQGRLGRTRDQSVASQVATARRTQRAQTLS